MQLTILTASERKKPHIYQLVRNAPLQLFTDSFLRSIKNFQLWECEWEKHNPHFPC